MDSTDQGVAGLNGELKAVEPRVRFEIPVVSGSYVGDLEGDTLRGTWSQGVPLPLELERVAEGTDLAPERPQHPEKPYPYREEAVRFDSGAVSLAGTLTLPEGDGPHPAVVLVSGSGPQDRDETLIGHKPFLVLADHLTRAGIAVLRYDDRGVGESKGDFATATTVEFADDALAAVGFLKGRGEIDNGKIGIIGHSEGGIVAPMAANRSSDVAFVVLLAPPAVPGREIILEQTDLILTKMGVSAALVALNSKTQRSIFTVLDSSLEDDGKREKVAGLMREAAEGLSDQERIMLGLNEEVIAAQSTRLVAPWYRYFLNHDPADELRKIAVPVLALFGEKDLQVTPDQNATPAAEALSEAGVVSRVQVLEGLNHLFQTAETGLPAEYGAIAETFDPGALEIISGWIAETVR